MSISQLFETSKMGVLHINFVRAGNRIASGTAFVVGDFVITNNHVFIGPTDCDVVIRFADSSSANFNDGATLPYREFAKRLVSGSDERNFDFAILRIPEVLERARHRFVFADSYDPVVGESVVFLGYPFDHLNLACHAGIVSSIYQSGQTKILQLDASVNHSNSGGPLLNVESGQVIGIITRKATGLSRMFQELQQSFEKNIQVFQGVKGMIGLGGVDPMAALEVSQRQMQRVTLEIERSANVGIGYAFSVEHVASDAAFN